MSASATHPTLLSPETTKTTAKRKLPLLPVAALLETQQSLTAVERFAKLHEASEVPRQARYYRDLIPFERPRPGQQYGFEVDLDACTGCKACVAACHSLNGLDDDEVWRTVGLLHGGTAKAPALQTVTTSCHHCLEPACMLGCPVKAYEKDPITGIVKHLDDQCIGCQYCTLMCPYDAPKYNKARGIVRKCDMCSDRLAHDEAPACVQSCPNGAIAIRIVEQSAAIEAADAHAFLPGAPAPEHTLPATVYKTSKPMPNNMLPADFYASSAEHSHLPLVIMLVLMQLATGAFALNFLVERFWGYSAGNALWQASFAAGLAFLALFASVFHLGRPHLFYRAFLGLRTSWMSREAVAFGIFAKLAVLYAVLSAAPLLPEFPFKSELVALRPTLHLGATLVGALGVFFSVMVYVATRRPQWSSTYTGIRFFGTMLGLGGAAVLVVQAFTLVPDGSLNRERTALLGLVLTATLAKLGIESWVLWHRRDKRRSVEKRMAAVMLGDLWRATALRFFFGTAGGVFLPLLLLASIDASSPYARQAAMALFLMVMAAEFSERYLFFRAAPASRMPGGLP